MSVFKKLLKNVTCFVIYFKLAFLLRLGFSKEELTWLQSLRGVPHVIQTQLSPVLLYLTDLESVFTPLGRNRGNGPFEKACKIVTIQFVSHQ